MIGDLDTISDDTSHLPDPIPFRKRGEPPKALRPPVIDRLHGAETMTRWTEIRLIVFAFLIIGFIEPDPFASGVPRVTYDLVAIAATFYVLGKLTAFLYKKFVCFDCV